MAAEFIYWQVLLLQSEGQVFFAPHLLLFSPHLLLFAPKVWGVTRTSASRMYDGGTGLACRGARGSA